MSANIGEYFGVEQGMDPLLASLSLKRPPPCFGGLKGWRLGVSLIQRNCTQTSPQTSAYSPLPRETSELLLVSVNPFFSR